MNANKDKSTLKFKRILLKYSGEALMGEASSGIDPRVLDKIAREVAELIEMGVEVGLVIGGLLVALGLGGSFYALTTWGRSQFGPLDPFKTMRMVIPSVMALTLGCQVVFSSFFVSVLGLKRR